MRFSPNPNNFKPKHYDVDVILEEHVGMYEYVNPNMPQKPYFIISNPIGVELEYLECILNSILSKTTIKNTIEYEILEDNIIHVVISGLYHKNGHDSQEFYNMVMELIPDKIAISFLEIRHNARLQTRYIRLASTKTSITNIKIEDIEYVKDNHENVGWFKTISNYLWSIPSYLTLLSNNQSNA